MGKNTMIRKAIRGHLQTNPDLEKLLPYIVGNVGFVFTNGDLSEVRAKLLENRRVRSMDTFSLFNVFESTKDFTAVRTKRSSYVILS